MMDGSAVISTCGKYRYELWRQWEQGNTYALFIGLNPSTADASKDDPTIRRCIRFARDWGYPALCMVNLFAWRETNPQLMLQVLDPFGPQNNEALRIRHWDSGITIAAWGTYGMHKGRGTNVRRMLETTGPLHHLGLTIGGYPKHPLYLRADTQPVRWSI